VRREVGGQARAGLVEVGPAGRRLVPLARLQLQLEQLRHGEAAPVRRACGIAHGAADCVHGWALEEGLQDTRGCSFRPREDVVAGPVGELLPPPLGLFDFGGLERLLPGAVHLGVDVAVILNVSQLRSGQQRFWRRKVGVTAVSFLILLALVSLPLLDFWRLFSFDLACFDYFFQHQQAFENKPQLCQGPQWDYFLSMTVLSEAG
jgi:hypothetical protein